MNNSTQQLNRLSEYRRAVGEIAAELGALAAVGVPLAVRPELAALVWTVEQCGGVFDLLTGEIDWNEWERATTRRLARCADRLEQCIDQLEGAQ